MRYQELW